MPPPKIGDLNDEVQGYKDALDLDPSDLVDLEQSTPKEAIFSWYYAKHVKGTSGYGTF